MNIEAAGDAPIENSWLIKALSAASEAHRQGDLDRAEAGYRQVLGLNPDNVDALHLLGVVLGSRGRPASGIKLVEKAIASSPDCAFYHSNLGNLWQCAGRPREAVDAYRKALSIDPSLVDAHANLAGALTAQGLYVGAEIAAKHALDLDDQHPVALANYAGSLIGQLRFGEAIHPLSMARQKAPWRAEVWLNAGHLATAECDCVAAEQAFTKALELDPAFAEAKKGLAFVLVRQAKFDDARKLLEEYIEASPEPGNAHTMLGHIYLMAADEKRGLDMMRQGISRPNTTPHEHSTFLFDLNYLTTVAAKDVYQEHRVWAKRHGIHPVPSAARTQPDPQRKLRLGFVSSDFRAHSVSFFMLPLLRELDRDQFESFCYSNVRDTDPITLRFKETSQHWRDIWGSPDTSVVDQIKRDKIDILFDLGGHSADNRLGIFHHRPAPLQIAYLGYPNTTGLETIDARLVDPWTDPDDGETDALASEKLVRLERCFLSYQPDSYPAIGDPPCNSNAFVTFGSFNNVAKVNNELIAVWARILDQVPNSKLLMKHDAATDPLTKRRIMRAFDQCGIDTDRITFLDRTPDLVSHLECYNQVDIALDTFPYNGTTTTCEALWMGVPVVTLSGRTHAGRVGTSLLNSIDLHSCIAADKDDYCNTALSLAQTPQMLSTIRLMLRHTMMSSPLCDPQNLAEAIGKTLRGLWANWCATQCEER